MINLKELDKTIEYLNILKEKEKNELIEKQKETIKNEIIKEITETLKHFESETFAKFNEDNNIATCFEFNFIGIINEINKVINVDVWEIK